MSAEVELLREAARVMRERANAATPGPWAVHTDGEVIASAFTRTGRNSNGTTWIDYCRVTCDSEGLSASVDEADGAHIASWHPAVALAVADWLVVEADHHASRDEFMAAATANDEWVVRLQASTLPQAVAVARAYLGRRP